MEQHVVVQAELPADALAVRADLRAVHVFFRRHVPGLFQQRQVDHRRRVALRTGIPIPVPGAAEVAALLDEAHVDSSFPQPGPGDQAGEPAADAYDGPVIGPRRPFGPRRVGIVEIVREFAGKAEVLVVAVRAEPLVPLFGVPAAQRVGVDAAGPRRTLGRHPRLRRMGPIIIPNEAASPDSVILTLFRHFATRDILLVAVIRTGIRRYAEQIPAPPAGDDLCGCGWRTCSWSPTGSTLATARSSGISWECLTG